MQRFAGLNIRDFSPVTFSQEYFHGALVSGVCYLTTAKYLLENFCSTFKNRENRNSLAQRIFAHLQYVLNNGFHTTTLN